MSQEQGPKPPRSIGELQKTVRRYASTRGLAEKRVRDWIAYMAIGGALGEASSDRDGEFAFRGGVALELRQQGTARATQDLDLIYSGPKDDLTALMEDALGPGYGRFTFRRSGRALMMERAKTTRVEIAVRFDGSAWATVPVDIAPRESHHFEVENVPAIAVDRMFGIAGPNELSCISLRYHLAQKIHGATATRDDGEANDRVQDAVDILILRLMLTDLSAVRAASIDVFQSRDRHAWPPIFDPPEVWAEEFRQLAVSVGLEVQDLAEAIIRIRHYITEIEAAPRVG